MKFVCLNCETYMTFQKVEKPGEGSLGVFFGCPSCEAKFSMVTNPGETQMVASLGVKLGGRTETAEPFEMTRGTLKDEAQAGAGQMAAYLNEKIQGGQPASVPQKNLALPHLHPWGKDFRRLSILCHGGGHGIDRQAANRKMATGRANLPGRRMPKKSSSGCRRL